MKISYQVSLAAFAVIVSGCGDAGSDEPRLGPASTTTDGGSTTSNTATKSFKMGDPVDFGAFEITIKSLKHPPTIGVLDQRPAEGGVFIAIDYTLKNTGEESLSSFDQPTLRLMDGKGQRYAPDSDATMQYVLQKTMMTKEFSKGAGGDLNPGLKMLTGAVWEIAEDRFDRSAWKVVLKGHENAEISLAEPRRTEQNAGEAKNSQTTESTRER